jgi:glutathionylspermidine synthase
VVRLSEPGVALFVDLPAPATLAAAPPLSQLGVAVVPVVQRWCTPRAVLSSRPLLDALVAAAEIVAPPRDGSRVVLLLDGERAGRRGLQPPAHRFDNRYDYPACRFPPPELLRREGVTRVLWLSRGGIAPDLRAYAQRLAAAGLPPDIVDAGPRAAAPSPRNLGTGSGGGRHSGAVAIGTLLKRGKVPEDHGGDDARAVPGTSSTERTPAHPDLHLPLRAARSGGRAARSGGSLLTQPDQLSPARYRRFLRRCLVEGLLSDHLVAGEPYLALNALVLGQDDLHELRRLTEAFSAAFETAGRALRRDVPTLVAMGFPWVAAELLAAEAPRVPIVGRFDFVRDETGRWWLLEFNADTPSGLRETVVGEAAVAALLPEARRLIRPSGCLAEQLGRAFEVALAGTRTLGLVTSAGELEDLSQIVFLGELLRPRLARRGIDLVVGDAHNLRPTARGARLCGRPIDALYRLLPFEGMLGTPSFAALYDAVLAGRLRLLNGLYGFLLQHKGVMAWLWAHRRELDEPARTAVERHLPPTWWLSEPPPDEARQELVAKQVFGREGEEVFFGADLSDDDWAALRRRGGYIAQRRVAVAEVDAVVSTALGATVWRGHPTVGGFAVDGRFGGFYTRFGPRLITVRSKWLATLVEPPADRGTGRAAPTNATEGSHR